jgi:hypothetical protein
MKKQFLGIVITLCLLFSCLLHDGESSGTDTNEKGIENGETAGNDKTPPEKGDNSSGKTSDEDGDDSPPGKTSDEEEEEDSSGDESADKEKEVSNGAPQLVINELRTVFTRPRAEFIEFRMLSAGNLGGLRVFTASNGIMIYEFPPIRVNAGEYVTLHLRTLDAESRNEYGDDLTLSAGQDSSPTARDLWIPGSSKLIENTDAVYVLDQNGKALTAIMIAERPGTVWERDFLQETAVFLFNQGVWKSTAGTIATPLDAVDSTNTSPTRTINRDETAENTFTAADFYVTVTRGDTPGGPNDPRRN